MEWLAISLLSVVVFAILTNFCSWAVYPMWISLAYPVLFSLIMIWNAITNLIFRR